MDLISDIETHLEKGLDINLPDTNGNSFLSKRSKKKINFINF